MSSASGFRGPPAWSPIATRSAMQYSRDVRVTVYQYPKCGTCRKALKWLDQQAIDYRSIDIVASPPSRSQLQQILKRSGVPLKALFNTSGESYRQGGFKDKLATLTQSEALAALAADGKLIKRPLVVGDDFALVGFDEASYARALR